MIINPLMVAVFVTGASLVLLVSLMLTGRNRRVDDRIQNLAERAKPVVAPAPTAPVARFTKKMLPKIGTSLIPNTEEGRTRLQSRLMHAGLYNRTAMVAFLGAKMLLMTVPLFCGFVYGLLRGYPLVMALLFGLVGCSFGMILPGFWLDMKKSTRQAALRRALPDALDMIIVCLRGGLSFQAAFQRVAGELWMVHPLLAAEFSINQREMQLGRSTGEAMKHFADRSDLEEIRSLASVIHQAERLGASTVNALRVHADTLRVKRLQRAEELAHKAGTKMVFPTILCIFPAILLVVIGPAAIQIADLFASMK
jgi:tight adherence protein C